MVLYGPYPIVLVCAFAVGVFSASVSRIDNFTAHYDIVYPASEHDYLREDQNYWWTTGTDHLKHILQIDKEKRPPTAKNVIIFIGDGMGVSTITAGRIYKGQRDFKKFGEEHNLNVDRFPNVALVKTYNVDRQVPDSAGTATALFTGVKTRYRVLGLDVKSASDKFDGNIYEGSKLDGIMTWAQAADKDTGIVTTTRITHATPAATFAQINHRDWECDGEIPINYRLQVKDIAQQLIEDSPGKNFKVILGGGQQQMGFVWNVTESKCSRLDRRNLTNEWIESHRKFNHVFAYNNEGLAQVNEDTEYLLGLFDSNHMPFEMVRNRSKTGTPSLTEMTRKALQVLKKSRNGYVLMVEGGLIDQAHHKNFARMALGELSDLDNAISLAVNETGDDTLILVTADHSHSFTMNGYAMRGNDIMGFGNETAAITPYLTLGYGNGPGFDYHYLNDSSKHPWRNPVEDQTRLEDPWYQHMGTFSMEDETHGGEDVALYGKGPGSHLVRGVIEQHFVAHIISYAACIGPHADLNDYCISSANAGCTHQAYLFLSLIVLPFWFY